MTVFPKGKHDDQVDSTAQFLDWFKRPFPNQGYYEWRANAQWVQAGPPMSCKCKNPKRLSR
jgi:hypothetical protein